MNTSLSRTDDAVNTRHGSQYNGKLFVQLNYDPKRVEAFLDFLDHGSVGGITEIRILPKEPYLNIKGQRTYVGKTVAGYYDPDHYAQAAQDIAPFDGRAQIYVCLNPGKPDLLARSANRLQFNAQHTATDADILCVQWLRIDCDPVRPSGISSSDDELKHAMLCRDAIAADLAGYGAEVIEAMSGNGGHLLLRLPDYPNDEEHHVLIADVTRGIAAEFSDELVNVDTSVCNAARIWKVYGTLAVKGDDVSNRPHRRATIELPHQRPVPFDIKQLPHAERSSIASYEFPEVHVNGAANKAQAYASGALKGEVEKVKTVPDGQKHGQVLRSAIALGGFVPSGTLTEQEIEEQLFRAVQDRADDPKLALRTIRDGIRYGCVRPRQIPDEKLQSKSLPAVPTTGSSADDTSSTFLTSSPSWPDPPDEAAYHGLAGEIVHAIEPHTEADPVALLTQFLPAFGNLIGRTAHFVADGSKHHLNVFAVLVGVSSKGRKGTSLAHVKRVFANADAGWASTRIQGGLSSGEGVIWAVRDPIYKTEPVKEKGKLTGEYIEVLADPGVKDKRLLVQEAEFASVLRVLGRDGNTLSAILRQAWDDGCLRVLTKNTPAHATDAHISIIGHITQDELKRYLSATESANGFGNRFLWCCVRRSKCLPEGGGTVDLDNQARRLQEVIAFAGDVGLMERDRAARQLWHDVYPELSEGKLGLLGAMTARAEAQVMRLAALYALLDKSRLIRICHLEAALALWKYCEDSAGCIFGDALGDPIADEILRQLRRRYPAGLKLWEIIHEVFHRNQKADRISAALTALLQAGHVRFEQQETEGRKAEVWFAVPATNSPQENRQTAYDIDDIDDKRVAPEGAYVVNVVNVVATQDESSDAEAF